MNTAEQAGVPYFTRRKWRARRRVPAHWWPTLVENSNGQISNDALQSLIPAPAPQREGEAA